MPSVFDKRFKAQGFSRLKREFSESVVYRFRAGGTRTIDAIIERNPPEFVDANGQVIKVSFIIRIDNDASTGVLSSEVDTGGDEVDLLFELGDSVVSTRTVERLISQDSGVTVLGLR